MVWRGLSFIVPAALLVGACADDSAGAGGADGTDTDVGTVGDGDNGDDDGVDETAEGGGDSSNGPCSSAADCDDDNPCSVDACEANICAHEGIETLDCRPRVDVDFPQRGATIEGEAGAPVIVEGSVFTGYGDIDVFTLNGQDVAVEDDGSFSVDFEPTVGGNILLLETTDSNGFSRRRVQSFLWSTNFRQPTEPTSGISPQGLLINLDQEVIDDGQHDLPADDLATLLQLAFDNFDIGQFLGNGEPVVNQAGYDVYLEGLTFDEMAIEMSGIDGGIRLVASVEGIEGDLFYDCTNVLCLAAGGDSTGGLTIVTVGVQADMMLNVGPDHELDIVLVNVQTLIDPDDVDVYSDNAWTNILLSVVEFFVIDDLAAQIADELNAQVYGTLSPLLADGLAGLNFSTTLDFPSLAGDEPIVVDLITDWSVTDFHDGTAPPNPSPPQGGVVHLRGGGYTANKVTPYSNLGIPDRAGCGTGEPLDLPREGAIEIGLTDDLLNQILFAAWRGGLLQFPLPMEKGGGGGLYEDLEVEISGMLSPTANDCGPEGRLLAHIGDLQIDASLTLQGNAINFRAFTSMVVEVDISVVDGEISIAIPAVESMLTELTVEQDGAINTEPLLIGAVESQLQEQLIDALGSGGFGGIAIPDIDLSAQLGLPPGTAQVTIEVTDVGHAAGVTVITGHL
ncbi:MAG: hypothetical protein JKY37_25205 [Nannocystaceae bacterium]|nr:hypothetical protein [Nannocystaceae bacterium]